jgi:hypothetical protein
VQDAVLLPALKQDAHRSVEYCSAQSQTVQSRTTVRYKNFVYGLQGARKDVTADRMNSSLQWTFLRKRINLYTEDGGSLFLRIIDTIVTHYIVL